MHYQPPASPVSRLPLWSLPDHWRRVLWLGIVIGVVSAISGAIVMPERMWLNVAMAQQWMLSLSLGAMVFLAILYAVRAGWHVALRRVPEAMAGTLPLAVGMTALLAFGLGWVYPWAAVSAGDHGHALSPAKATWLSPAFVLIRVALCLGVWWLFMRVLRGHSLQQDEDRDPEHSRVLQRTSIGFLVVYALTFSLLAFDLMMSLSPHWFSTIFGIYQFCGSFLSAVAVVALLTIALRTAGALPMIRDDHLQNLGRLILAFCAFQAWVWYSQFMLIWYANIPEETSWYVLRMSGGWEPIFAVTPVLCWVLPVLMLLPRSAKRNKHMLAWSAAVVLAGQWLDRYLLIMPEHQPNGPQFGFLELGMLVGLIGLFLLGFFTVFARHRPVPVGDPWLPESLSLHI